MIFTEVIGLVLDLALDTDDVTDEEGKALAMLCRWCDRATNSQTADNALLGDRSLSDLVECDHPSHTDEKCPACSGLGRSWRPKYGWSNREALLGLIHPQVEPPAAPPTAPPRMIEPTLWEVGA